MQASDTLDQRLDAIDEAVHAVHEEMMRELGNLRADIKVYMDLARAAYHPDEDMSAR